MLIPPVSISDVHEIGLLEVYRGKALSGKMVPATGLSYLKWFRIIEDKQRIMSSPFSWQASAERTEMHRSQIKELFLALIKVGISEDVKQDLRKSSFDIWQWSDAHILAQIRQMYIDLGIVSKLNMDEEVLQNWLLKVNTSCNMVPFHNFRHCISVTQMMYSLIWTLELNQVLDHVDMFTLLTASHDLDHPFFNNKFQENANTDIDQRHGTSSLEHHHVEHAFRILDDEAGIFNRFVPEERRQPFCSFMTRYIIATDLDTSDILAELLESAIENDIANQQLKHLLMATLVKISDVYNETRKLEISGRWLDLVLREFFNQNGLKKVEDLPRADFMDKDEFTIPIAQVILINSILIPLLEAVHKFFPKIQELIHTTKENMQYYMQLDREAEELKCKKVEPAGEKAEEPREKAEERVRKLKIRVRKQNRPVRKLSSDHPLKMCVRQPPEN